MEAVTRAKEVDEEMKVLTHQHSVLDVTKTALDWNFTTLSIRDSNSGWQKVPGTFDLFVSEGYIDLAGLVIEDKTVFPTAINVQRATFPAVGGPALAGDSYEVLDVLTSIPVDLTDTNTYSDWLYVGPGMSGTSLNFEHVLYARRQRWTADLDTSSAFLLKADEAQWGSMSPTASDRIYSYRLVWINEVSGSTWDRLYTSNVRHIMAVETAEEPTYQYIMRLKRSFDLQQVDRD